MDPGKQSVGIHSDNQNRSIWLSNSKVPEADGQPLVDTSTAAGGRKKLGGFAIVGLIRWLITALLLMGFVLAVHFYQGKVLDNNDKSIFESIIVTLSLIVGLNIASALKDIAKQMRWWFLSLKRRDLSEVRDIPFVTRARVLSGVDSEVTFRSNSFCKVTAWSM